MHVGLPEQAAKRLRLTEAVSPVVEGKSMRLPGKVEMVPPLPPEKFYLRRTLARKPQVWWSEVGEVWWSASW